MPTFIDRHLPGERGVIAKSLGQAGLMTLRFYPTVVSYQARDYWRSLTGRDFDREANYRARDDPRGPQQTELYCAEGKQMQNANGQSFVDLDVTGVKHGRVAVMMCNYLRINPGCRGAEFEVSVDGVVILRQTLSRRELEDKRVFLGPQLQIRRETGEVTVAFSAFPKEDCCPPRVAFVMKYSRDRMAEHPHKDPFASRRLVWGEREMLRERSIAEQPPPIGSSKRRDRSPASRTRSSGHYDSKRSRSSYGRYDRYDRERHERHRERDSRSSRYGDDDEDDDRRKRSRTSAKDAKEPMSDADIRKAIELAFTPPDFSDGHKRPDKLEKPPTGPAGPRTSSSLSGKAHKESKDPHGAADPRRPSDARLRAYSPVSTLSDRFDVQDTLKLREPEPDTVRRSSVHQDQAKAAGPSKTAASTTSQEVSCPPPISAAEPAPLGSPVGLNDLQVRNAALETEMIRLRLLCDNRRLQREVEMLRQELESGKKPADRGPSPSPSASVPSEAASAPLQLPIGPPPAKRGDKEVKPPSPQTKPLSPHPKPASPPADCGSSVAPSENVNDGATDRTAVSASQSPVTSIGSMFCASTSPEVDQKLMRMGALLDHPFEDARKDYFSSGPASAPAIGRG